MAQITNYATLATAVQAYLGNNSVGVASGNLDYLLQEVEHELNGKLRVRRMLTSVTPTVSAAGVVTLPTDFGGWKRFVVRDGSVEWDLDLLSAEESTEITTAYATAGRPKALLTVGSTSQIWPFQTGYTYTALYYARIPALTSGAANWVITAFPMVYLYGCLAAASGFIKDITPAGQARFDIWQQRFRDALRMIQAEDAKDVDARSRPSLSPDTSLFSGGGAYNVLTDGA